MIIKRLQSSIADKLFVNVFAFYVLIACIVAAVITAKQYSEQKTLLFHELSLHQKEFGGPLSNALWTMDLDNLHAATSKILAIPIITGVKIVDHNREEAFISIGSANDKDAEDSLTFQLYTHEFPLDYSHETGLERVGYATFYTNSALVFDHISSVVYLVVSSLLFMIISLWGILRLSSHYVLTKPLSKLTTLTENLEFSNLDDFQKAASSPCQHELSILENAFLSMVDRLKSSQREISLFQLELEQRIVDRTAMLEQEVAEHKKTEQAMHEAAEFTRKIIEESPVGISICDLTGQCILANSSLATLIGATLEQVLQQNFYHIDSWRDSGLLARAKQAVAENSKQHIELAVTSSFGKNVEIECTFSPFSIDEENFLICLMNDISERKEAERELIRHRDHLQQLVAEQTQDITLARDAADKANQAKSEFLTNMSHEMRTPMHAILSFSDMGKSKIESVSKEKIVHYFTRIHESGSRLLVLVNDLLDLSKLEAGRMEFRYEEHDLVAVVEEVAQELDGLLHKKSLTLDIEQTQLVTVARIDFEKMLQVIRNLVSNAIKFTPDGKTITVTFAQAELPSGLRRSDTGIVPAISVSVSDQGVGIPEEELESVFDKFTQSSKTKTGGGGTGLGLAICKEIVEGHCGSIQAGNNPGGGAIMTVTIPYRGPRKKEELAPE